MKLACSTNISKYYDWRSYWYDLSVCSNGLLTLNEISGCDTTSDARQEPVASGHSGDNTDRGDRGAGDLEPRQSSSDMRHQYIYTDQTPDIMLNTRAVNDPSVFTITGKAPTRAFSWLKAPTSAFTFKTLLRHYPKWTLTNSKCMQRS